MADRDVNPDDSLMNHIFGTEQPTSTSIILQNWEKCIFRADFSEDRLPCVVRLEAEDAGPETFIKIAAMQEIASSIIPELVPKTYDVGKVSNADGRRFQFSVISLVEGDLLEDVWEKMGYEEKVDVVAELTSAISKLHYVKIGHEAVQQAFRSMIHGDEDVLKTIQQPGVFGGPFTGFLDTGTELLNAIMEQMKLKNPFWTLTSLDDPQYTEVVSLYEDLGSIVIEKSDMAKWPGEAVFCHNDLNPRNIIVQSSATHNGGRKYKLAGIIDWELAGFYPPSYELSMQDTNLSGANRQISYYLLLKEHMAKLVPRTSSQVMLLRVMEFIWESRQRCLLEGSNIPAHIRKRFLEMGGLVRDEDPYVGWRMRDSMAADFGIAAAQKLEDDVVEEMLAKRRIKT